MKKRKPWTRQELDILRQLYPDHLTGHIATKLGRTDTQVYNKAYNMGLQKSQAFKSSALSGRLDGIKGTTTRFTFGHTPANKGTKGLTVANRTSFAKGNLPHNHKPIGSTRVDVEGYHWTKISEPKTWAMTHRLLYEQHYGPIPPGMAVKFRDKNKANLDPANLYLSDRVQLMKDNTVQRYPSPLPKIMQTLGRLKNKIQKHGKKQN